MICRGGDGRYDKGMKIGMNLVVNLLLLSKPVNAAWDSELIPLPIQTQSRPGKPTNILCYTYLLAQLFKLTEPQTECMKVYFKTLGNHIS